MYGSDNPKEVINVRSVLFFNTDCSVPMGKIEYVLVIWYKEFHKCIKNDVEGSRV